MPISFTLDLEDHTGAYAGNGRWVRNTHRLLEFCAARNIRGTFFTVGRVAAAAPELLKAIIGAGHELALHSYDHIPLTQEDSKTYRGKLAAAKKSFEEIGGKKITGFRAPVFSLNPKSRWVVEDLARLGFTYSSSVISGQSAFAGYPGAPTTPFQWPEGIIELPVPAVKLGPASLPYLGGVYLRYLPLALVRVLAANTPADALLWTYLHPYDIDTAEGFTRLEDGTPLWANILLMNHREHFLKKLGALLQNNTAPPLGECAATLAGLPVFSG